MIARLKRSSLNFNDNDNEENSENDDDIFDLLVIGGGATGAGVALDAATRGLRVALVERGDFSSGKSCFSISGFFSIFINYTQLLHHVFLVAYYHFTGTSSKSTKLVHGGVRYLQKAVFELSPDQYALVKEALHERSIFLHQTAPYLSRMLPIALPVYRAWEVPYYYVGCKMYDFLAGGWAGLFGSEFTPPSIVVGHENRDEEDYDLRKERYPSSYLLTPSQTLSKFPTLKKENLKGAVVYYDGQHNDSRMGVAVVLTAVEFGAVVGNYLQVVGFLKDQGKGKIKGTVVKDLITGEEFVVRARGVVNATGPYADSILALDQLSSLSRVSATHKGSKKKELRPTIAPSSGVHITLPMEVLTGDGSSSVDSQKGEHVDDEEMGLLDASSSDGRVVFVLPWLGAVIAGTTDSGCEVLNRARIVSDAKDKNPQVRIIDPPVTSTPSVTTSLSSTITSSTSDPTCSPIWSSPNPSWVEQGEVPTEEDVQWVLGEVRRYLSKEAGEKWARREDIKSAWAGIRPLVCMTSPEEVEIEARTLREETIGDVLYSEEGKVKKTKKKTEGLVRNHVVYVNPQSGLLTIIGGKWTTYRKMAEDAVDEAVKVFDLDTVPRSTSKDEEGKEETRNLDWNRNNNTLKCITTQIPLIGTKGWNQSLWKALVELGGVEEDVAKYLASSYGSRAWDVLRCGIPTDGGVNTSVKKTDNFKEYKQERIHPSHPNLLSEVRYAVRYEYARSVGDVLERRTRMAYVDEHAARSVWEKVGTVLKEELDLRKREVEIQENTRRSGLNSGWLGLSGLRGIGSWIWIPGQGNR